MATFYNLIRSAYNGKKVIVTGHSGFKGSWLSVWLTALGAEVIGISLDPPSQPNMFDSIQIGSIVKSIHTDIRDSSAVIKVFENHEPDIVFHLAAQSLVIKSYINPVETFEVNVMGTVNILEAARLTKTAKAIINVTSDKCYENREWAWGYRESDPMGGKDPYSASKGCSELVSSAYYNSMFVSEPNTLVASARAGNVIGGGDWGEFRLIPDCIRSLTKREKIKIRRPDAIRPWQHVLEPLSGYLLLGEKLLSMQKNVCGGWNFGPIPNEMWTVKEVVDKFINAWGSGGYVVESNTSSQEAKWLKLDCSKALIGLNWSALLELEEALSMTADWYKQYYKGLRGEELYEFTAYQIKKYCDLRDVK